MRRKSLMQSLKARYKVDYERIDTQELRSVELDSGELAWFLWSPTIRVWSAELCGLERLS